MNFYFWSGNLGHYKYRKFCFCEFTSIELYIYIHTHDTLYVLYVYNYILYVCVCVCVYIYIYIYIYDSVISSMNSQKSLKTGWTNLGSKKTPFVNCSNERLNCHLGEASWKGPSHPVLIYSYVQPLLSISCVPGTVLGIKNSKPSESSHYLNMIDAVIET